MSNRLRTIRKLGIGLLGLVLFLFPPSSFADVCFDDDTAGRMVVTLEQAKITLEQLQLSEEKTAEVQKQVDILTKTIVLLEGQIEAYELMMVNNKQMSEAKDKVCQEQIKAATPTFMDNLQKYMVGAGAGAVIVGLIILGLML